MDNAFEKARAAYGTGAYDDATLEFLFPQLKESEEERNERMRKRVIESLVCYRGKVYDEGDKVVASMVDEEIIWMRKQKENPKSPDSIPSDCVSDAKCEDRWHKVEDFLPDNGREVLAKDKLGNTLLARYDGEGWDVSVYDNEDYRCHISISKWCEIPSEKQKEQPQEELVYRMNGLMQEYIKEGKDEAEKEHRFKCYQLFWDALEDANFFEQKEQKPDSLTKCVFSKEDERFIRDCANILIANDYETSAKRLLAMFEPKPAWSEEDEETYKWVCCLFRDATDKWYECVFAGRYPKITKKKVLAMLKHLRPSWKPSEEQMEALERCVEYLEESDNEDADIMAELYEQLKQL